MSDIVVDFKAPINFEYVKMNDLNTKDMIDRGYKPKGVGLRTHENSMYGFIGKHTFNFKEAVKIPLNIAHTKKGKQIIYNVYNKNSWGFDDTVFYVSGKRGCLEKLTKYIHQDNLKRAEHLKKCVSEMFNFEIPEEAEIRPLDVFVAFLYVEHMETGQELKWVRKLVSTTVEKDGKSPGLVLMSIDGKTINCKKRENRIHEIDLWNVGKAFTNKEDDFCLLGPKDGLCPVCL